VLLANLISESFIFPASVFTTLIATFSCGMSFKIFSIASREPKTSTLIIILTNLSASGFLKEAASLFFISFLASVKSLKTLNLSPAIGGFSNPKTITGVDGKASFIGSP